jgi:glycerol-3-phosphate dehydrogenase
LSGPSFAAEVARHLPTALVAASTDANAVLSVQDQFRGPAFRLYGSDDVVGVEIGAALKNIIAIAAGVTESMNLGHNAMSALITRGLAEIFSAHHARACRDLETRVRDGRPARVLVGAERPGRSRAHVHRRAQS